MFKASTLRYSRLQDRHGPQISRSMLVRGAISTSAHPGMLSQEQINKFNKDGELLEIYFVTTNMYIYQMKDPVCHFSMSSHAPEFLNDGLHAYD